MIGRTSAGLGQRERNLTLNVWNTDKPGRGMWRRRSSYLSRPSKCAIVPRTHSEGPSDGKDGPRRTRLMKLQDFVAKYAPHPPRRQPINDDESRQLGTGDGVFHLTGAPATGQQGQADEAATRHLWVFRAPEPTDLPYILEGAPKVRPRLASGSAKHTNLTGGGSASCGGELWIDLADGSRLWVNGCSGRYGPTSREQLDDAAEVFRQLGFDVVNYGWDDDTQKPHCLYFR